MPSLFQQHHFSIPHFTTRHPRASTRATHQRADTARTAAAKTLFDTGIEWIRNGRHKAVTQIGDTGLNYVTSGGMSWGDSPFDEFDAVTFVVVAAECIPELAKQIGVVGSGIHLAEQKQQIPLAKAA